MNIRSNPIVVFDGSCGFCRKTLNYLQIKLDLSNFIFIPFSQSHAQKWNFPQEVILNYDKYMYVITPEGDIYRGFFAFKYIISKENNCKFINRILDIKLIQLLGLLTYKIIASNRGKLSGKNSTCGL
jgi:predicted DCC family thiol-disulfide oxidoreductase YuxK